MRYHHAGTSLEEVGISDSTIGPHTTRICIYGSDSLRRDKRWKVSNKQKLGHFSGERKLGL